MKKPLIYIGITNYQGLAYRYNGKPLLKVCLDSLLSKTKYANYKVIVADDKSTDGSVPFVRKNYPKVGITVDPEGWHSSRNINSAIRSIKGPFDFFLLMSNDVIVRDGEWLSRLVSDAQRTKADIIGCKLLYPDGRIQNAGSAAGFPPVHIGRGEKDGKKYSTMHSAEGITAALMMISKHAIDTIGMYNEQYNFGPDDMEYCIKARKAGLKIIYDGKVSLVHLEGATSSNLQANDAWLKTFYYGQIGFIHFVRNNFGLWRLPYLFLYQLGYCIISVGGKSGKRGLSSIRIKNAPLKRIYITLKAWKNYALGISI